MNWVSLSLTSIVDIHNMFAISRLFSCDLG